MTETKPNDAEAVLHAFADTLNDYFSAKYEEAARDDGGDLIPPRPLDSAPTPASPAASDTRNTQPWTDLTGVAETNLLYKIPPDVVAKMDWVINNVPRMSRQRIVRDAVAEYLDKKLAQLIVNKPQ
jgi:hypothetical protein